MSSSLTAAVQELFASAMNSITSTVEARPALCGVCVVTAYIAQLYLRSRLAWSQFIYFAPRASRLMVEGECDAAVAPDGSPSPARPISPQSAFRERIRNNSLTPAEAIALLHDPVALRAVTGDNAGSQAQNSGDFPVGANDSRSSHTESPQVGPDNAFANIFTSAEEATQILRRRGWSERDVDNLARHFGVRLDSDFDLLDLVRIALATPVPEHLEPHHFHGMLFFYKRPPTATPGDTSWLTGEMEATCDHRMVHRNMNRVIATLQPILRDRRAAEAGLAVGAAAASGAVDEDSHPIGRSQTITPGADTSRNTTRAGSTGTIMFDRLLHHFSQPRVANDGDTSTGSSSSGLLQRPLGATSSPSPQRVVDRREAAETASPPAASAATGATWISQMLSSLSPNRTT